MFGKLREIEKRYTELEALLGDPSVVGNRAEYQKHAKEHADLRDIVEMYRKYESLKLQVEEDQQLLRDGDEELRELIKEEIPQLKKELEEAEARLRVLLLPKDPNDSRNIFWRSVQGPEEKRRACLPPTCSGCMPATPKPADGKWRSSAAAPPAVWAGSKRSSP